MFKQFESYSRFELEHVVITVLVFKRKAKGINEAGAVAFYHHVVASGN